MIRSCVTISPFFAGKSNIESEDRIAQCVSQYESRDNFRVSCCGHASQCSFAVGTSRTRTVHR